jgi:hypothetical protein
MRTLTIDETEAVAGQGIIAVPVYYGVIVMMEAAPAIAVWAAGAITGAGLIVGGYVASKG